MASEDLCEREKPPFKYMCSKHDMPDPLKWLGICAGRAMKKGARYFELQEDTGYWTLHGWYDKPQKS